MSACPSIRSTSGRGSRTLTIRREPPRGVRLVIESRSSEEHTELRKFCRSVHRTMTSTTRGRLSRCESSMSTVASLAFKGKVAIGDLSRSPWQVGRLKSLRPPSPAPADPRAHLARPVIVWASSCSARWWCARQGSRASSPARHGCQPRRVAVPFTRFRSLFENCMATNGNEVSAINAEAWIEQRKWRDALVAQVPAFDPIALAGDIQRPSTRSGSRPRSPAVRTELFVGDRILSQYPRRSVTPTSERMTNRECAGQVHCPRNLAAQMRSDAASGSSFQARLAAKLKLGGGEKQWHLDCGVRPTCAAV